MKKYSLKLGLFVLMFGMAQMLQAQFTASGTITSDAGEPLIGASILVKGTTQGTITDIDGAFSIQVPGSEGTLVITYIGYQEQEVAVSQANASLSITMIDAATALDEIVVTGYGTSRKEALTGSVQSLRADKLEQVPLASFEQTLQGNIAGLQANMGNGQPGSQVQIRIRGQGSISASSEPLYVIDGLPVYNPGDALTNASETSNVLAGLNPNDIESVTVLKDASATAIYGARAANGVILITTKSGKEGKPKLKFNTQIGFNDWAVKKSKRFRGLTATEYTDLFIEGEMNRGRTLEASVGRFNSRFPDPITGLPAVDINLDGNGGYTLGEVRVDTRWIDEITRTGKNQSYDLSVSGGGADYNYFASASYFDQESPIIGVGLDRYSTRLNVSAQATPRLKVNNNLSVSRTHQTGPDDATAWSNPMYNAYLLAPTIPVRDATGLFYADHKSFFMGGNNPVGSLSGDDDLEWTMLNITDNFSAEYEIMEGLSFKSSWGVTLINFSEFYFRNARYGDGRNVGGFGSETNRNITNWIGTQTLNYSKSIGDHNLGALVGYEANKNSVRSAIATAESYPPNSNLRTLNNAAQGDPGTSSLSEYAFESIFSQVNYNYDYKYYLQASIRRDGSSRFGLDNREGTFWSIGAAWRLDQESFLQNSSFFNELKLRASYGITGNAEIGNYDWLSSIGFGFDYDGSPGGAPSTVGNRGLTWEESKAFNIGLDFRVLNRISGTVEYFNRLSDNLLLDVPVSRTTGFRDATVNFGAMENKGFELTLDVDIMNTEDFNWTIGTNMTFIKNEITKLDEPFTAGNGDRFRRAEGHEYNEYYVYDWAGVDPQTGKGLFYVDESRTETTSDPGDADPFYIGKSGTPDFYGGFNTAASYKGFSVSAQFNITWNNWIYDDTAWVVQGDGRFFPRSQTNLVLNRWQQPGDITDVPQFRWGGNPGSNTRNSTRYIFDGSHIRLRNLTMAYQIPSNLLSSTGLESARVYFRGVNIWTWTKDSDLPYDPEAAINGFMESVVPNLKTFSFGLDIGF